MTRTDEYIESFRLFLKADLRVKALADEIGAVQSQIADMKKLRLDAVERAVWPTLDELKEAVREWKDRRGDLQERWSSFGTDAAREGLMPPPS